MKKYLALLIVSVIALTGCKKPTTEDVVEKVVEGKTLKQADYSIISEYMSKSVQEIDDIVDKNITDPAALSAAMIEYARANPEAQLFYEAIQSGDTANMDAETKRNIEKSMLQIEEIGQKVMSMRASKARKPSVKKETSDTTATVTLPEPAKKLTPAS